MVQLSRLVINTVELANLSNPFCFFKVKVLNASAKKLAHIRRSLILVKYLWGTQPSSVSEILPSSMVNWQ
jgi:hypothetical protein